MEIYSHEEPSVYQPPIPTSIATQVAYHETIVNALTDRRVMLESALSQLTTQAAALTDAALLLVTTLRSGRKVLVAGNGGSAAQAQHFAAELVGRFKRERSAYAAISLSTDTAILTAVANDYGFQNVFARQIQALGQPGDLFVAFSTSGESENLVCAAHMAHQCLVNVVAVTGSKHSCMETLADITVRAPGIDTATAQELHMMVTHILCDIAEKQLSTCQDQGEGVVDFHTLISGKENEW